MPPSDSRPGSDPPPNGTTLLRAPFTAAQRRRIAQALAAGELMSYPTETSYALGGNALDAGLVRRVYEAKGRPEQKALLLLVDGARGVEGLAAEVAPAAARLMEACWPGALTLVLPAGPRLPHHLRDARGTVALRWSSHPVVAELLAIGGVPLIGTSANRSGGAAAQNVAAVLETLAGAPALVIDGGALPPGPPSTLVDTTRRPFRILRTGALPPQTLRAALAEFPEWAPLGRP